MKNTLDSLRKKTISKVNGINGIDKKSRIHLIDDIKEIFDSANLNGKRNANVQILHHLSPLEQSRILRWIDMVLDELP